MAERPNCFSCPPKYASPATRIANAYGANKDDKKGQQLDWPVCEEHAQWAMVAGWFPIRKIEDEPMPANPNLLPVSEAAREAAGDLAEILQLMVAIDGNDVAAIRNGIWDETARDLGLLVQAFARFEQSKDAAFVEVLEAIKEHCDNDDTLLAWQSADEAIANAKALGEGRVG